MDKYTWQDKEDGVYAQDVNQCTYEHTVVYEGAAIDRLFEYESTDLTPDEIAALRAELALQRADNDRLAGELEAAVADLTACSWCYVCKHMIVQDDGDNGMVMCGRKCMMECIGMDENEGGINHFEWRGPKAKGE